MRKRPRKAPPEPITELQRKITAWREQRSKPGRMPEELWSEATRLGREYGVSLVSRHLKLDYHGLKRRVLVRSEGGENKDIGFVELRCVAPQTDVSPSGAFVTEMEICKKGEVTMRVRQSGPTGIELPAVVASFLRES